MIRRCLLIRSLDNVIYDALTTKWGFSMTLQQTHFEVKEGPWYTKSCIFYERTYLLSAHVILQGQNLPDIITIASFKRTHIFEWAMRDQTPFLKNGLVVPSL